MQQNKQKSHIAYAKACKSNSKNKSSKKTITPSPRNKKSQNIYEQLMNQLELDQSQYIQKLCKKNQEKVTKKKMIDLHESKDKYLNEITNSIAQNSQKNIANHKRQIQIGSKTNFSSTTSLKNSRRQNYPRMNQSKNYAQQIGQENNQPSYFLNNIDQYIAKLKQNQNGYECSHDKIFLNKNQFYDQRQYRKTVQIPSNKSNKSQQNWVPSVKYSKLLDKLHEQLIEKQALEYTLNCKDIKMIKMKKMIQSMHKQIIRLQRQIIYQKQQKQKYSQMASEFVNKIHHTRASSKQKHYIPQHQKRNSHIPSSNSYSKDFIDIFNKTGWQQYKSNVPFRNQFQRNRERDQISTLKKKGMHKHKNSQFFNDGESQQASIYDPYL